jgi:cell fate regulator YaaT (PSP1 superfamily)
MKLVSVEYTFDNSKILFYFTANGRVDFRSLVKDLASVFKTRIELRQIGVRDEAKMLGGLGPCGRPICCGSFLGDFQPVSIKMAKEQNLSLNPTKISGVCGRLMCCLKYEQDNYELTRKRMPKVGKEVIVPDGRGVVWDVNVIKETVRVRIQKGDSSELKDYPMTDVQRVAQQGAPESGQVLSRDENDSIQESEERPARKERPAKPYENAVNEKPASVSPWLAAVDHAMRTANNQDGDIPEEFLDGAGEDEDFTLAEEESGENPDDLLNFPDLMEEAPEAGSEEDEQP